MSGSEAVDGSYDALPYLLPDQDPPLERLLAEFYPDWHKRARCLGGQDEDWFGAQDTQQRPALSMSTVVEAQKVCAGCPVFEDCLTDALVNRNEFGIWAATSGRTRRRIWDAVDAGLTTVADVVNAYVSGDGERYDRAASAVVTRRLR